MTIPPPPKPPKNRNLLNALAAFGSASVGDHFLDAKRGVALTAWGSAVAAPVAEYHAEMGTDVNAAAKHGTLYAELTKCWWLFVFLPTLFFSMSLLPHAGRYLGGPQKCTIVLIGLAGWLKHRLTKYKTRMSTRWYSMVVSVLLASIGPVIIVSWFFVNMSHNWAEWFSQAPAGQ